MLQAVHAWMHPAAMRRLTLLINHVLGSEPAATQRLAPHAHKVLRVVVDGTPAWWPFSRQERMQITPAGLLEWQDGVAPPDEDALTVRLALRDLNPATLLATLSGQGLQTLPMQIDGDAQLAADVDWVVRECRWDIEADLAQWLGPVAARQIASLGRGIAAALHRFAAGGAAPAAR
jgi:ubiquinone biosynthesis accessory factor UbiJ